MYCFCLPILLLYSSYSRLYSHQGSISSIYKIQKKDKAIGGSSRENFLKSKNRFPWYFCPPPRQTSSRSIRSGTSDSAVPTFALKEIDLRLITPGYVKELYNEIELLKKLDHPNIIKAYETYVMKRKTVAVVMELCTGGDLYSRHP